VVVVPGTTRTVIRSGAITAKELPTKKTVNPALDRVSSGFPTAKNLTVSHDGVGVAVTRTDAVEEDAAPPIAAGCSASPMMTIRNTCLRQIQRPHRHPSVQHRHPSVQHQPLSVLFQHLCPLQWEDKEENVVISNPISVPK